MEPIIIVTILAVIAAAAQAYTPIYVNDLQRRNKVVEDFKDYLITLADCLDEMANELNNNRKPTKAGNRIEKAFENFHKNQDELNLNKEQKADLDDANERLKRNILNSRFLDDVIDGKILNEVREIERKKILQDMTRTSGYLRGVADTFNLKITDCFYLSMKSQNWS